MRLGAEVPGPAMASGSVASSEVEGTGSGSNGPVIEHRTAAPPSLPSGTARVVGRTEIVGGVGGSVSKRALAGR